MLDHISIGVSDLKKAQEFYDAVLKPLGLKRVYEVDGASGYGRNAQEPRFWIAVPDGRAAVKPSAGTHIAFAAGNRRQVDRFHEKALAAGAKDNGKPGLRPHYHPNYYGAFAIDPDGHRIEAVCHLPARAAG